MPYDNTPAMPATFEELRAKDFEPKGNKLEVSWPEAQPVLDFAFYPSKGKWRIIPTHTIHSIDVDTEEGKEHRIVFTHSLGLVQVIGDNLEGLAELIYTRKVTRIHTGPQEGGGNVKRVELE